MARLATRAARRYELVFFVPALLAGLVACAGTTFREHGPRTLEAGGGGDEAVGLRAWDPPRIAVSPPEVLAGQPEQFTVREHSADGQDWIVALEPGAGEPVEIRYRIADGMRLPIEPGEELWLNQSPDGRGLVVRDAQGVRVVVSVDGALADVLDQAPLTPAFDAMHLTYSELVALPSGCVAAVDHHALELERDRVHQFLAPGSVTSVRLARAGGGEQAWTITTLDVSRLAPRKAERDDPRCPPLGHVSWVAVRADTR